MNTILITGGAGFIGSALVRLLIQDTDYKVVNLDKLTYAGSLETLQDVMDNPRHIFVQADICDAGCVQETLARYRPDKIIHLAAETHVDRSIDGPAAFVSTNIVGSYNLLERARDYFKSLDDAGKERFRFHHVSTDEVYGSLSKTGYFTEETPYKPNSPYSASKASSDHLVRAWYKTYGLPTIVSNCSNNYGPYQHPEKLVPLMINKAVAGEPLPVYGRGDNVRDWLYVEDHARALLTIMEHGSPGEMYNVGGDNEISNIDVVHRICAILEELKPSAAGHGYRSQIQFVADRPGHDQRYAIDATKIKKELGWRPRETFDTGLRKTVLWYLENPAWCAAVSQAYRGERLGIGV